MNIEEITELLETSSDELLVRYTKTERFDGCPSVFIGELWKRFLDLKNEVRDLKEQLKPTPDLSVARAKASTLLKKG